MAANISFSGSWTGEFVYGEEYGNIAGEKATFMLFVDKNENNSFEGRAFDIDGTGVNNEVATVRGFLENESISFIKQYPTMLTFQEDGTLEKHKSKASPEIHYTGEYIESKKSFIGEWEMVIDEVKQGDEYLEYLCTGTWEMRKEED